LEEVLTFLKESLKANIYPCFDLACDFNTSENLEKQEFLNHQIDSIIEAELEEEKKKPKLKKNSSKFE
jgi:hypothetical protein